MSGQQRPGQQHRVTFAMIAAEAGVSVPTVSRVVNGRADVAQQTRERVEHVLERRGYKRRGRRAKSSAGLLDLVFNDLDSPWAVEIIRGVEDVAHGESVGTVVSAIHRHTRSAMQWLQNVRARNSDGVILVTSTLDQPVQAELDRLAVPTVVVDPAGNQDLTVPVIGATNWAGGIRATEHLLSLGHRRIGAITGPSRLRCSRARLDGYRSALENAGIVVEDALIRAGDFHPESGYDGAEALLDQPVPPTAIFACSDQMALGVYESIRQRGLRVPDDISVVGFDDLPEAQWSSPPLTTVRQPLSDMGAMAARIALRLSRSEPVDSPRVDLSTELVVRESTTSPANGHRLDDGAASNPETAESLSRDLATERRR